MRSQKCSYVILGLVAGIVLMLGLWPSCPADKIMQGSEVDDNFKGSHGRKDLSGQAEVEEEKETAPDEDQDETTGSGELSTVIEERKAEAGTRQKHKNTDDNKFPEYEQKANRICNLSERRRHLTQACSKLKSASSRRPNLLVDDQNRVLYCVINKVASSMMKRFFTGLRGGNPGVRHRSKYLREMGLKKLLRLSEEEQEAALRSYTKIILVRHPLDRLKSAYYNKFVENHLIKGKYYTEAIQKYRQNKSDTSEDMHFDEFAKYIMYDNKMRNTHWRSYDRECSPCSIKYDYILRMETLEHDMSMMERDVFHLSPHLNKTYTSVHNSGTYKKDIVNHFDKYMTEMGQLDEETYKALMDAGLQMDMDVFGYKHDKQRNIVICENDGCC